MFACALSSKAKNKKAPAASLRRGSHPSLPFRFLQAISCKRGEQLVELGRKIRGYFETRINKSARFNEAAGHYVRTISSPKRGSL